MCVLTCQVECRVKDPDSGVESRLKIVLVRDGFRGSFQHRLTALQHLDQSLSGNPAERVRSTDKQTKRETVTESE